MPVQSNLGGDFSVLYVGTSTDFARETASAVEANGELVSYEQVETVGEEELDGYDAIVVDLESGSGGNCDHDAPRIPDVPKGTVVLALTEHADDVPFEDVTDHVLKTDSYEETLANRLHNYLKSTRNGKEPYEETIEFADDAFWMFEPDFSETLVVSSEYTNIFGRPEEEIRENPTSFVDAVHPDDRGLIRQKMEEISSGNSVDFEIRVNPKEEYSRWAWIKGGPIKRDGELVAISGFVRDVTERKERERKLLVRTRAIEKADVSFCFTDPTKPDNPMVYVNEGFERLTGYDEEEAVGRNCRFLQGDDANPRAKAELRRAVEEGEPTTVEILNYKKDGTPFWNQIHISPIYDEDEDLVQFVGSQRDVTEQRRNRERLKRTNERLDVLYETVNKMMEASSSVRARELTEEAPRDLGYEAEYYVWNDETGEIESMSSGKALSSGSVWAAYVSREPFLAEDVVAYPVSDDGVIYVSTADRDGDLSPFEDRRSEELQEFVSSLATSAEAALARFEHRAEVLELAEKLEDRKERMEALDEIDEAIREMARRIPRQTDRESMEQVACESLLNVDAWDFALIASPTGEGWVTHASSNEIFASALTSSFDSTPNPVSESVVNGEPNFVESVAKEENSKWRKFTLEEGYLSVATLPIAHSGETYGVLQVYSEEKRAFAEMYKSTLRDAAEMLGYAISSTERMKSSVGGDGVRLTLSVPDAEGPVARVARESGAKLKINRHVSSKDGYTVYASPDEAETEDVVESIRAEPSDSSESVVCIHAPATPVLEAVTSANGLLRSCWYDPDASAVLYEIDLPFGENHREVVDRISDAHTGTNVVSHRTRSVSDSSSSSPTDGDPLSDLTCRQVEVLETAYYGGFFNWPKESTGNELADELGVSSATFHQHLKSAEKKIVSSLLES